jgi:hypothetical protein
MNTYQINSLLSHLKCFIGTYPRDLLPKNPIKIRPCALIINTDKASEPGEHWVAIYLSKENCAEYFDSFGFTPYHTDILKFLSRNNIKKIIYNVKQLQSVMSKTCGAYCVLFVKFRCLNFTFCDVINYFSSNTLDNDMRAMLSLL